MMIRVSWKRFAVASLLALGSAAFVSTASFGEKLFELGGKTYSEADLTSRYKFKFYEAQHDYYTMQNNLIESFAVDLYLEKLAKKAGKSADALRDEKLKVGEPTEDQLKKFYEENKQRIPYPYDQIKDKLTHFWQETQGKERFDALVAEVKADKELKFVNLTKEPLAPRADIKSDGYASKGKPGSKVTIVEFADYKCPHCKHAFESLQDLMAKYDTKVQLIFMDFPIMPESQAIAEGAFCAGKLGKFWDYHKYAFEKQGQFKEPVDIVTALQLDQAKFKACMDKREGKATVENARKEGERVGVSGTPTIYINGYRYTGGLDKASLKQAVEDALAGRKFAS